VPETRMGKRRHARRWREVFVLALKHLLLTGFIVWFVVMLGAIYVYAVPFEARKRFDAGGHLAGLFLEEIAEIEGVEGAIAMSDPGDELIPPLPSIHEFAERCSWFRIHPTLHSRHVEVGPSRALWDQIAWTELRWSYRVVVTATDSGPVLTMNSVRYRCRGPAAVPVERSQHVLIDGSAVMTYRERL